MYILDRQVGAHHQPPRVQDRCVVARAQPHRTHFRQIGRCVCPSAGRPIRLRQEVTYQIELRTGAHLDGVARRRTGSPGAVTILPTRPIAIRGIGHLAGS